MEKTTKEESMSDRLNPTFLARCRKYNVKHIDRSLTLFQLYITHKGKCQHCQRNTVLGVHPQIETSATMEHIIPLAHGGNHVKNNVTLYCQKCNSDKNKTVMQRVTPNTSAIVHKKIFSFFGYSIYFTRGTI